MTMRRNWAMFVLILLLALTAGCETIKGLGRDIQNAGEAIDDAVR